MREKNTTKIDNEPTDPKPMTDLKKSVVLEMFGVFSLLSIGLLFIIGRLFYVQVLNNDDYVKQAEKQQQSRDTILPQRGNIYDRNAILLASSIKYISIAIDPTIIRTKKKDALCNTLDSIAILLEKYKAIPKSVTITKIKQIQKENSKKKNKQTQYIHLANRIASDKESYFKKLNDRGIIIETEYIRHYNYSNIASQILGHTDNNNRGKGGIERQYDSILSGISGYRYVYKDAKGNKRSALDLPTISPIDGANLYLTIDINLQEIVEYELAKGVLNAAAEAGTIIALDPETGELLACASYPNYNPNNPAAYNDKAARIRSITDVFEPGSTFKAITATAGIEEKIVTLSDIFNGYQGLYQQPTYSIRDEHPLGIISFYNAFVNSSNIILSELAVRIKKNIFMKYIRDFGFGALTGIDLPGEIRGYVPKLDSIKNVDLRYLGHGYQIAVTPIQMVCAYSAIANDGNLLKPYIVKKIVDKDSITIERNKQPIRKVMSLNTSMNLKSLLTGVIREGTGAKAFVKNLKIAGKTGTAQKLKDGTYKSSKYIGSFIGFYPADKPKICMLVMIDEPQNNYYGGAIAAPIFKNIALRYTEINSDIINNYENKGSTDLVYVPELKGLKYETANKILNSLDLKLASDKQTGIIIKQNPYSGAKIKKGGNVKVSLEEPCENLNIKLPKVVGLPLRNAISVLHTNGYKANINGSGKVYKQEWKLNGKKERICYLKCR
jgi:cell division protein FtsI (penicillin-binding protein 3)